MTSVLTRAAQRLARLYWLGRIDREAGPTKKERLIGLWLPSEHLGRGGAPMAAHLTEGGGRRRRSELRRAVLQGSGRGAWRGAARQSAATSGARRRAPEADGLERTSRRRSTEEAQRRARSWPSARWSRGLATWTGGGGLLDGSR
jgi:hypothetical protein